MAQNFWIAHLRLERVLCCDGAGEPDDQATPAAGAEGFGVRMTEIPRDKDVSWWGRPAPVAVVAGVVLLL
jgi:hypothetical protein